MEALRRGSDGGASVAEGGQALADFAAALKEQTEALKEALSARNVSNSITSVKTDLVWPTLTDDKSDTKDVVRSSRTFAPSRTTAAAGEASCLAGPLQRVAAEDVHQRLPGGLEDWRGLGGVSPH